MPIAVIAATPCDGAESELVSRVPHELQTRHERSNALYAAQHGTSNTESQIVVVFKLHARESEKNVISLVKTNAFSNLRHSPLGHSLSLHLTQLFHLMQVRRVIPQLFQLCLYGP